MSSWHSIERFLVTIWTLMKYLCNGYTQQQMHSLKKTTAGLWDVDYFWRKEWFSLWFLSQAFHRSSGPLGHLFVAFDSLSLMAISSAVSLLFCFVDCFVFTERFSVYTAWSSLIHQKGLVIFCKKSDVGIFWMEPYRSTIFSAIILASGDGQILHGSYVILLIWLFLLYYSHPTQMFFLGQNTWLHVFLQNVNFVSILK